MAFPNEFLNNPQWHQKPIDQRRQELASKDPEFAGFAPDRQTLILTKAAEKYGKAPAKKDEGLLSRIGQDVSLGFRSGVADIEQTGANLAGMVGAKGVQKTLQEKSKKTAPSERETAGRDGLLDQIMMGIGAAPPAIAKYAPAALAKKFEPVVAGGIGVVSNIHKGPQEAITAGIKDAVGFGLAGKAAQAESRVARAAGSAAAQGGVDVAFGGDAKSAATSAVLGGAFGAVTPGPSPKPIPKAKLDAALKGGTSALTALQDEVGGFLAPLARARDEVRKRAAPQNRSVEAKNTALTIRRWVGEINQSSDIAAYALEEASNTFKRMPDAERMTFMHSFEDKSAFKSADPKIKGAADAIRNILDRKRDELISETTKFDEKTQKHYGPLAKVADALRNPEAAERDFYLNYFPHLWKDPTKASDVIGSYYAGKKPLGGPKTMLHERQHFTIADGLKADLELLTTDPVEASMLKIREMDRFIASQRILKDMLGDGLLAWREVGDKKGPAGWVPIKDNTFATREKTAEGKYRVTGNFWAPESAARVLNNYLSPGLRQYAPFRALSGFNNSLNMVQLGASAFHLGFATADSVTSTFALGIEQAVHGMRYGNPKALAKGALNMAKATPVGAPFKILENISYGRKLRNEWQNPGSSGDPHMALMVDTMKKAGAGVSMDPVYRTNMSNRVNEVFRTGQNYMSLMYKLPLAGFEKFSGLILDQYVPLQKLAVFSDMARWEMEKMGELGGHDKVPHLQAQEIYAKAWDSVDNRLGLLRYDNLFWDKVMKDLLMASVRSVGWNLGTLRELGGGVLDSVIQGKKAVTGKHWEFTHRMAYSAAMPIVVGMMGSTLGYIYNKNNRLPDGTIDDGLPHSMEDLFFPRTGKLDRFGRPERVGIPSYMKDVWNAIRAVAHDVGGAYGKSKIVGMAASKLHPSMGLMIDMLRNEDFYHTEISNPDDPLVKRLFDKTKFVVEQFKPMGVTNIRRMANEKADPHQMIAAFFGIVPTSEEMKKTKAEELATQIMADNLKRRPMTQEGRDTQEKRRDLERKIRQRDPNWEKEALRQINEGELTEADVEYSISRAGSLPLDRSFKNMQIEDALRVLEAASDEEKARLLPVMEQKVNNAVDNGHFDKMSKSAQKKLADRILKAMVPPKRK